MAEDRKAELPTAAGPTIPESRPPAMPDSIPPGTMQLRPGEVLDASLGKSTPIAPTFSGGPTKVTHSPPSMPHERYQLGDEIARGGMGRVVEANDAVLGRTVALKEALALDADSLKRFERETKITARLEHPSIVPVHDAGTMLGGAPYYVMRKISGRPLERLVALAETLDERLALVPHIVNASNAIAHAHERGVVHRDIKPSNILVGDLGETIVIDWGLAKMINEADDPLISPVTLEPLDTIKTRAGIVYGTPGFMAPEQLRGKPVNERCDVYALGATLYHLLCRKPPHHAKTADEMMKAAAAAPPPPITEIVAGVPPELSTIVDKCLAHDPAARYQTARELAEDLQRFLTGQLVASHHYSTGERARRFVKRNKVPVAATVALFLVIVLALVRVRGERDRADEAAHVAREEKRIAEVERANAQRELERVTLQQARNEVEVNPTRALARIRNLAAKHPREVRSIGIAARASGIAWSLPASKLTNTLQLSSDGNRVLTAGEDGVVRIADLEKRTMRVVVEMGASMSARFADNERRIVVWKDAQLVVMNADGDDRRPVTAPAPIIDLEVVGMSAYWTDKQRRLYSLDLAGTMPVEVPLAEPVDGLTPSPDGRWIALKGADHLMLFDRTAPSTEPTIVTNGRTRDIDWNHDGTYFAAIVDDSALSVRMPNGPEIVNRRNVGNRVWVASANERAYSLGPTGVALTPPAESTASRKPLLGDPINVVEARGRTFIAASQGGIAVLADSGDIALRLPEGRVKILDASANSPYVVATVEGRLLVWNLDELQPQRIDVATSIERTELVGNTSILLAHSDGTPTWIDIATGKQTVLDKRVSIYDFAGTPNGALACIVDPGRRATLFAPNKPSHPLEGTVSVAAFATDHDLLLADEEAASLRLYNTEKHTYTTLFERKTKLLAIGWTRGRSPWIAAAFLDGTLWRKNLTTGADATSSQPIKVTSELLVLDDGTVMFGEGKQLRAWRPDGTVDAHAQLPEPAVTLGIAGQAPAIAITREGATYLVELDKRDRVTEIDPINTGKISMARDTGTYVVATADGFDVVDPVERHRWRLGSTQSIAYREPTISADGRHIIAHTTKRPDDSDGDAVIIWTLPDPPADLTGWIDSLTNADIDATGRLIWR